MDSHEVSFHHPRPVKGLRHLPKLNIPNYSSQVRYNDEGEEVEVTHEEYAAEALAESVTESVTDSDGPSITVTYATPIASTSHLKYPLKASKSVHDLHEAADADPSYTYESCTSSPIEEVRPPVNPESHQKF